MKLIVVGSYSTDGTASERLICLQKNKKFQEVIKVDIEKIVGKYSKRSFLMKLFFRLRFIDLVVSFLIWRIIKEKNVDLIIFDTYCPMFILCNLSKIVKIYITVDSVVSPGIKYAFKYFGKKYNYIFSGKSWERKYIRNTVGNKTKIKTFIQPSATLINYNNEKIYDVCFLGHHNKMREKIISKICENKNLRILIGGPGWEGKLKNIENLVNADNKLYGNNYYSALSSSHVALGFLNDSVGDLYTTRTVEVPAVGCCLLTKYNRHQAKILGKDGAVFLENYDDFISFLNKENINLYKMVAIKGQNRVISLNLSWQNMINKSMRSI